MYSNDILGEFNNCGCSENQFGGLPRKAAKLDEIRSELPHVLHLDAGNLFFAEKPNGEIERAQMVMKAEHIVQAYNAMECDALNIGHSDLLLGLDALQKLRQTASFPFVSSNIIDRATGTPVFDQYRALQINGLQITIMGVCSPDVPQPGEISIADPTESIREVLKTVIPQSDMIILLSACGREIDRKLSKLFPAIRIIVSGNNSGGDDSDVHAAGCALVSTGKQGQYLGRLDVTVQQKATRNVPVLAFSNILIPLSHVVPGAPRITAMVNDYTIRVQAMNKQALFKAKRKKAGLDQQGDYAYIGADACATCHPLQFDNWFQTPHADAYKTLSDKGRKFDTECLSCHTTGYGEPGGYDLSQADASPLLGVQCESCHGPGSNHDGTGNILRTVASDVCVGCHAEKRSPQFDYNEYVSFIACPSDN